MRRLPHPLVSASSELGIAHVSMPHAFVLARFGGNLSLLSMYDAPAQVMSRDGAFTGLAKYTFSSLV
jgi:hypothetical protein